MIIKICGNKSREDLLLADKFGADILGVVVEVAASKRSVDRVVAKNLFIVETDADKAMLLCDRSVEDSFELIETVKTRIVHLTGNEPPETVEAIRKRFRANILKSLHLPPSGGKAKAPDLDSIISRICEYKEAGARTIVLDTSDPSRKMFGGTGMTSDWTLAAEVVKVSPLPVLLAGGISPDNVREAIVTVRPHGVDLASGVESSVGIKDPSKVKKLFDNLKSFLKEDRE